MTTPDPNKQETHYDKLGVDPNATTDEIFRARRKLAKTYHPDFGGDEVQFKVINEAVYVLTNPTKRAEYDRSLT